MFCYYNQLAEILLQFQCQILLIKALLAKEVEIIFLSKVTSYHSPNIGIHGEPAIVYSKTVFVNCKIG